MIFLLFLFQLLFFNNDYNGLLKIVQVCYFIEFGCSPISEQRSVLMCFSIIYAVIITHAVMRQWKGLDSFIHGLKNGRSTLNH